LYPAYLDKPRMKRISRIITFSALLTWVILAEADAQSPIRYSVSVSVVGFADSAPTATAETVTEQGGTAPSAMDRPLERLFSPATASL
jgi:hypothetical protein